MLSREFAGKGGPEGGNRRTLPYEDEDYGKREGDNKDATVHEDAPVLDNRENSILEQNATIWYVRGCKMDRGQRTGLTWNI